ncbi:sulfotransferase family protein [Nitrosopumilus sp.]|uniref:sulfotransferase family protein n=1 Tax=Nitrosopumilus sp. TaxID=2024843 RepID=UPI003D0D5988
MYLKSQKSSYKRFYRLFIKRHFFGITSPLRVLPDFFVIGAGRTGTTSLYHYLDQHPSLSKSAYDELGFFDVNFHLGLNWYRSLFPSVFTKFRIKLKTDFFMTYDVTPSYVRRPWIAKRIKKLFPKSKLIIVLRNPVDRTYSHYHLHRKFGETRTFEEFIKNEIDDVSKWDVELKDDNYFATKVENSSLARAFYAEQLPIWFEQFSKNQILIISSENLASNTRKTMNEIFSFLNLPEYDVPNIEKVNVSKKSKMNSKTREILLEFFKPYNEQLYDFLNKKFDWEK